MPPELLQQYGHSPQRRQPPEPRSVAVSSPTAGEIEESGWQGSEAGRSSSVGSIRGSLRRKYSRLPSTSSAGGSGSAGTRSNSFAAAAAAAGAAAGLSSRGASFRVGQQGGREPPAAQPLGTIEESERASSSSSGSGGHQSADGGGSGAARPSGSPREKQQPATAAPLAGPQAAATAAGAPQQVQSPPLLQRLRLLLPGSPQAAMADEASRASPPQQMPRTTSRSRSLLRALSSRQLSRVAPKGLPEDSPAPAPAAGRTPSPRALQQAVAAATERLQHRPPSLAPDGPAQQEQARLLAAAKEHLRCMQAASDEAVMHAERRQVGKTERREGGGV